MVKLQRLHMGSGIANMQHSWYNFLMASIENDTLRTALSALVRQCDSACRYSGFEGDRVLTSTVSKIIGEVRATCAAADQSVFGDIARTVCEYMTASRDEALGKRVPTLALSRQKVEELLTLPDNNPASPPVIQPEKTGRFPVLTEQQKLMLKAMDLEPLYTDRWSIFADSLEDNGDPRAELVRYELKAAETLKPQNVHGLLSVWRFFGDLPDSVFQKMLETPRYPLDLLKKCSDHILVLDPGLSQRLMTEQADAIDQLRQKEGLTPHNRLFYPGRMHLSQPFADTQRDAAYMLLPPKPFRPFFDLTVASQLSLQDRSYKDYEIASLGGLSVLLLLHEQDTHKRLLPHEWLRCNTVDSQENHVHLGDFGNDGIMINSFANAHHYPGLGLALFRKHPKEEKESTA